jgi:hypothetical protein
MSFRATTVLVRLDHKHQTRRKILTGKYLLRLRFCLETIPCKLRKRESWSQGGKKIEISCDTYELSLGTGCVSASVWGDELGRVLQPDVLGDEFDQVVGAPPQRINQAINSPNVQTWSVISAAIAGVIRSTE